MLPIYDPQAFMEEIAGMVPMEDDEIFLTTTQYAKGMPAHRCPPEQVYTRGCTHVSVGLFDPQEGEEKPRRSIRQLTGMWCLLLDDVGTDKVPNLPETEPSFIIETSPGSQQWGYVFATVLRNVVSMRQIYEGAANAKLTDPGGINPTRVFRLPGSRPPGKQHRAKLIMLDSDRVFAPEGIEVALDMTLAPAREFKPPAEFDRESGEADPIYKWMMENEQQRGYLGPEGWLPVDCPYSREHSDGDGTAGYRPASKTSEAQFHCFHAHSGSAVPRRVTIKDFRLMLMQRGMPSETLI